MAYRMRDSQPLEPSQGAGSTPVVSRPSRRRKTLSILPTLCTLANLLAGFASIFFASRLPDTPLLWNWSPLTVAAVLVFVGMLFDGLDGRLARLTRSTSDLGEQLDSMADMVTFGVAPAFMAVQLVGIKAPFLAQSRHDLLFDRATLLIACIYVACAALRLARFNIEVERPEEADHSSFKGLPSPGAAGTVASLVLLHQQFFRREHWAIEPSAWGMVAVMLLVALAMVSTLRYVHVANRYIRGRAPIGTIGKVVIVLLLLAIYPQATLALAFTLYAISAPLMWGIKKVFGGGVKPTTLPPGSET